MISLKEKTALIFGVANERSIAWGIAKELHKAGCKLGFTYVNETLGKRVRPLAESVNSEFIEECDVSKDGDIAGTMEKWKDKFGSLDILVHSVAFADRNELKSEYFNTSREGFHLAMDISVYSLTALTRAVVPLMEGRNGSIITLTYYGAEKAIKKYNVMGVAKSALESSVRYLASDLGPLGIRINAISAGPIKTLAASGIRDFKTMLKHHAAAAPMKRNVTQEEVGKTALYLCSDLASGVTGEVVHVDCGYSIMGASPSEEKSEGK